MTNARRLVKHAVRLDDETYDAIGRIAKREGTTRSAVMRRLVTQWVAEQGIAIPAAAREGTKR